MDRSPTIEDRKEELAYYTEAIKHVTGKARAWWNERINELKLQIRDK